MKKPALSFLIVAFLLSAPAFSQKGIKGLIDAEKAFASFTAAHSIKEGFLQYMDSGGIIFRQGKPVSALEFYQQQKSGPVVLSWEPAFAVISASGDFGITTGSYEIRATSLQDTVIGRGSFSSVWQINKQGAWKNLADLGVSYKTGLPAVKQVQEIVLPAGISTGGIAFEEVFALDKKFNVALKEKNSGALLSYLPADSWLNMEGEKPINGDKMIANILLHIPETVSLNSEAGNISVADDMAYVYGSVVNGTKKENYLRVWINRNKKWQVILQTIKW
jgi:hypothetical protein